MPKRQATVRKLYANHLKDLQSINPSFTEFVICPLCRKQLDRSNGNDGHVWSKYIRKKADYPEPVSRVLLCKSCNRRAGKFGDTHMQQHEKAKDGIAERPMDVFVPGPKGPHYRVRGTITGISNNTIDSLTFNLKHLSPKARASFSKLIDSHKISLNVHQPEDGKAPLAKAGWIQAAYLMAFYTFGYRYIFQPSTQLVYDYIHSSYESVSPRPQSDTIRIIECENCFFKYPRVELMVPVNADKPLYTRISMLQYHIHLPIDCDKDTLNAYLNQQIVDLEKHLPELYEQDAIIGCRIYCDKAEFHTCGWDKILAEPILPNIPISQ